MFKSAKRRSSVKESDIFKDKDGYSIYFIVLGVEEVRGEGAVWGQGQCELYNDLYPIL